MAELQAYLPTNLDELADCEASTDALRGAEYSVRVAVRVRPLLLMEQHQKCRECVGVHYEESQVVVGKTCFTFDHVFGSEAGQDRVYDEAAHPLIEGLGAGLNATLLAYGQTSAGKTFTLGSCNNSSVTEDQQGVIPRFVNALFRDIIYAKRAEADIRVRASFVELHNEDINDLLDPNFVDRARNVVIREDPTHGVLVIGMKEVEVRKPSELLRCLEKGAVFRTTASTQMNEQSSRSHAIFTVTVEQHIHATGDILSAKIRFADLAGSERAKKTGTVGERFREGVNINQGLLALGNVISALGDPKLQRSHVPYRDSKLTRMLQDTLGGNSRTVMIACVSPADVHFSETLNTLKYANRAKNIKNKVTVNVNVKNSEIAKLKEKIQELQLELFKTRQIQRAPTYQDSADEEDEAQLLADLAALRRSYDSLQRENHQLRRDIETVEKSLLQAEENTLHYRTKYEHAIANSSLERKDTFHEAEGKDEGDHSFLLRHATVSQDESEPVAEPPSEDDLRLGYPAGSAGKKTAGDELPPLRHSDLDEFPGDEEALAHAEEDKREEACFRSSQREMQTVVKELDEVIKEKELLIGQLTRQSKVFQSMRARYEMRLQELKVEVQHAATEKDEMLKELNSVIASTEKSSKDQHDTHARKAAEEASKRKAHLEGRLAEVNRQLLGLKRRQVEAQRLIRLKDQQEQQILRMNNEIMRLKGQKQVVASRLKYDEQQHRLWRKRWISRLREVTKQSMKLQRQNKVQGQLLQRKTDEAERSAQKVEELRREQQQYVNISRRRLQVDRELARAARLREANERLQRELEEREDKVQQMEAMLNELERLKAEGAENTGEVLEVEEHIETLDAQIDFDSECIAQSQTDILRLTTPTTGARLPLGSDAAHEAQDGQPEGAEAGSAEHETQTEPALEASGVPGADEDFVARLTSLDEARVTCLACFQSINDLREERSRLQARVAELETDLSNRGAQIDELQARERFAEKEWAEQANAMQRLHIDKEVYLLSRVDRNLAEEHGICEPGSEPGCDESGNLEEADKTPIAHMDLLNESPTVTQLQAAEVPASDANLSPMYKHHQALFQLLRCRTEQLELMEQQAEHLQERTDKAERQAMEADSAAAMAKWEAQKAVERAIVFEQRAAGMEQRMEQRMHAGEAAAEPLPEPVQRKPSGTSLPPLPVQVALQLPPAEDTEARKSDGEGSGSDDRDAETPQSIIALRTLFDSCAQSGKNLTGLEGITGRTAELLREMWRDVGLDAESQQQHLQTLARDTLRMCSRNLRLHERKRLRLQQQHDDLRAIAESFYAGAAKNNAKSALVESVSNGTAPLHAKHAALQAALRQELDQQTVRLRSDLQELFGLTPADCASSEASAQLTLLAGTGASTLPGRGSDAGSLVHPQDLHVLGIGDEGARHWLRQPHNDTFAKLTDRQTQVNNLLSETNFQLQKVSNDLDGHFAVFGLVAHREDFFANRGTGLPALAASQRELQRLQHRVRLSVAEGRVKMAEQWMELGSSGTEQEAVLQRLRHCAAQDALAELRAIKEETGSLGAKIELRKEILLKFEGCGILEQSIQEFEREASKSYRLRGSSQKLLQEEKQRLSYRKKKERLVEDLVQRLAQWEQLYGEPFLHNGMAIRDILQQDLDDTRELGGLSLMPSQQTLDHRAQQVAASAAGTGVAPTGAPHTAGMNVGSVGAPSAMGAVPPLSLPGNGAAAPSQPPMVAPVPLLSARGQREQLATRVRNASTEHQRRASPIGPGTARFSPVSRESSEVHAPSETRHRSTSRGY